MSNKIKADKVSKEHLKCIEKLFSTKFISQDGEELTKELFIKILLKMKNNEKEGEIHEF